MKKIKDFFHDSNDVLLAILIVLIAIGLVGWRVMIILGYPLELSFKKDTKTAKSTKNTKQTEQQLDEETEEAQETQDAEKTGITGTGDGSSPENAAG